MGKFSVLRLLIPWRLVVSRAAKESGYQLPEDLSVMGFDGIEFGAYYSPSLTTVRQPYEYSGRAGNLYDAWIIGQ